MGRGVERDGVGTEARSRRTPVAGHEGRPVRTRGKRKKDDRRNGFVGVVLLSRLTWSLRREVGDSATRDGPIERYERGHVE
jgi:hypothetical protein